MILPKARVGLIAALGLISAAAFALINPNFTPIHLVDQSALIITVSFGKIGEDNKVVGTVGEVVKGKSSAKILTFDLGATDVHNARAIADRIAAWGDKPALLFVGMFLDSDDMNAQIETKAFLHVAGCWVIAQETGNGTWNLLRIDKYLQATWAGGTDMLYRCVKYVLEDDDPDVPVNATVSWEDEPEKIGRIQGTATSAVPLDLDGDGALYLFVTSDKGDRLFKYADEALKDVTEGRKLSSASRTASWADLNGDGKLDLVSWTGESVLVYSQSADGTFAAPAGKLTETLSKGCLGITALDCGQQASPALLVSTAASPLLLLPGRHAVTPRRLVEGDFPGAQLGKAGVCLAADFDGDSLPDIIQPFEKGSLYYKGVEPGLFGSPTQCAVALGKGVSASCIGDFDADGVLDIFVSAEDANRFWHNQGGGKFTQTLHLTGELEYISKAGGVAAMTCDFNNDGRQDLFLAYSELGAHLFFNRGFRSFGHAHMLDLTENGLLPEAERGQRAGCVADFNGDGAQDMVLILPDGGAWVFWRESEEEDSLGVKVDLSPQAAYKGPLTVTGWLEDRCLGAWNVVPGTSGGFVGLVEAGPCTIKWRFPGGKEQTREVEVEDEPTRLLIK